MTLRVSINGAVVPADQASISIFDHGFLFGDSVYEVVRTWQDKLFEWQPHIDRLRRSADQIALELPWSDRELKAEVEDLIRADDSRDDRYVRIIVTRGVGELSLDTSSCDRPNRILIARPMPRMDPKVYREGWTLSLVDTRRNSRKATNPNIKSGNYLNNVIALMEARRNGAGEAIMLNEHGDITECTTSNLFVVKDGVARTPALECGLLAGITRAFVLATAAEGGIEAYEDHLRREDLERADEVFITSSTRDIVPVRTVDALTFDAPGPVTARLMTLFDERRRRLLEAEPTVHA